MNIIQEIYDMLKQTGIPLIPVDEIDTKNSITITSKTHEDIPKEIQNIVDTVKPKLMLIRTNNFNDLLGLEKDDVETSKTIKKVFSKNKSHIDTYIESNPDSLHSIGQIKKISKDEFGLIDLGLVVDGIILSIFFTDDRFVELTNIFEYVADQTELEFKQRIDADNRNYFETKRKEQEARQKEKERIELEKEEMISTLEEITNLDEFNNLKTAKHLILYWEKNHPDLYKILSRTFVSKLASKLQSIKTLNQ